MISGSDATPQTFVEMLPKYALIHYSGHADSDVLSSYAALRLAGDPGLLSAADIAKLSLPLRPLVVLAACGTFRGNATHAGGMASIARAFIAAGARGVVGTLWEIDDDVSAPLFLRFHQSLRAGASPARALREAQVDMLHSADARLGHPATWAPAELLSTF
jgi:CHAT domain-containing protein